MSGILVRAVAVAPFELARVLSRLLSGCFCRLVCGVLIWAVAVAPFELA